jgi:hypothetical protein
MSANPGTLGGQMPTGEDGIVRQQKQQQGDNREAFAVLAGQVAALSATVDKLTATTNTLIALAVTGYAQFTSGVTAQSVGYFGIGATVNITSKTGRIKLTYGGSLNSGQGYFVYSVTGAVSGVIVAHATVQANPAQRVAVSGGASFSPSGFTTASVDVPPNEALVVRLELYSGLAGTYFLGGSISVDVVP